MKKRIVLLIVGAMAMTVLMGCQKANAKTAREIDERLKLAIVSGFANDTIQNLVDMLRKTVMPAVGGADRKETAEIADDLERTKADAPEPVERYRCLVRLLELAIRLSPDDFDTQLKITDNYQRLSASIGSREYDSAEAKAYRAQFNAKAIQAGQSLVDRFPDNPQAYGQLAHMLFYISERRQDAMDVLHQCIKIDKSRQYCKGMLEVFSRN